jgi:anti-sigma factor RsiW
MNERHWSDERLIASLYGVGPEDDHLEECSVCRARLERISARRQALATEPEVSDQFLAAQRRSVYARIRESESRPGIWFTWAPAAALAATIVFGVTLMRLAPEQRLEVAGGLPESTLYTEIYNEVAMTQPRAVQPIRGLFEE